MPTQNGGTVRDALMSVWRQTGEKPAELAVLPDAPAELRHVMEIFKDLCFGRPVGQGVALTIPNVEIMAWCALNGIRLRPWELKILRILDVEYVKVMNSRRD